MGAALRSVGRRGALLASLTAVVFGVGGPRAQAAAAPAAGGPAQVSGDGDTTESREAAARRQACDRGVMAACSSLAGLYLSGTGVAKDEARAGALYRRACDGGNASGCEGVRRMVERRVASGQYALKRAAVSEDRLAYQEALQAFDEALALDPSHEKARLGRAVATRRLDDLRRGEAATSFVQDDTSVVASPSASTDLAAVRLLIEAKPARVRPGDTYALRYVLVNPSPFTLTIGAVSVRNALAGAGVTGGSVEPQSRTAGPGTRTLLVETKGTWSFDSTTAWATTLTVVLDDGSVYSSALRTRRE